MPFRSRRCADERRTKIEYEGISEVDEGIVAELVDVTEEVLRKLEAIGPVA
jgi:hypothetical protein